MNNPNDNSIKKGYNEYYVMPNSYSSNLTGINSTNNINSNNPSPSSINQSQYLPYNLFLNSIPTTSANNNNNYSNMMSTSIPYYQPVFNHPIPIISPISTLNHQEKNNCSIENISKPTAELPKQQFNQKRKFVNNNNNIKNNNSSSVRGNNSNISKKIPKLDTPEDLEKWKEERKARYLSKIINSTEEKKTESELVVSTDNFVKNELLDEISDTNFSENEVQSKEIIETKNKKSTRKCKYFLQGKCKNGDDCKFLHISYAGGFLKNGCKSKTTVFENLVKIEEEDSFVKFFDFLKSHFMKK